MRTSYSYIKRLVFSLAFFYAIASEAQTTYFQQEVNYTIKVKLDDEKFGLHAFEEMQYINNSPQSLNFIYVHLWPNAYKNNSTALVKQMLSNGDSKLYFAKSSERGFIDSIDFKANNEKLKWEYDPQNIDICKVYFSKPLRPHDTIEISTPFYVKIPDAKFSRLGHTGQAFFMTQWYPKPAVLDKEGWHPMPYLDQGEFYSEYGSFDVSVTLPKNYVLTATGDRLDASEEETFLETRVKETKLQLALGRIPENSMEFPPSSKEVKTVRFRQYRVHDFAWFADKRFFALKDQIELPESKRKVDTWVFFTGKNWKYWKDATKYVNESTIFYSFLNGDYPYNHVTAVDGTIMAGGGMEYPNITVIGDVSSAFELDLVITHEVGHNWFYGILGSNERDHPFLDEGINSLFETRYVRAKYPDKKLGSFIGRDNSSLLRLNSYPLWKYHELSFFSPMRARKDQPMNLKSVDYTESNYGSVVYSKTAVAFDYLMDYLGEENFNNAMREYFNDFKFKHPSPEDLFTTLERSAGKDLQWFRDLLYSGTGHIDYKIKSIKRLDGGAFEIRIKNKGDGNAPLSLYAYNKDAPIGFVWSDGFRGTKTIGFPPADADRFTIDGEKKIPEINRRNNSLRTKGIFKRSKPLQLNFVSALEDPSKNQLNLCPLSGYNEYDGYQLGLAFHNFGIYQKRVEYLFAPMYAFNSKSLNGYGELSGYIYPKNAFREIAVGVKGKTFSYDRYRITNQDYLLHYYRVSPFVQFEFRKKEATSKITQYLNYTSHQMLIDSFAARYFYSAGATGFSLQQVLVHSYLNQLTYKLNNSRTLDPYNLVVSLQHNNNMAKIFGSLVYKITTGPKKFAEMRLFAGSFLAGSLASRSYYAFRASGYNGWNDYLFEGNYLGRNDRNGVAFSQFMERDGALKVWTPLGQSSEWMIGLNLKSPAIWKFPVKLFADAVTCDGRSLQKEKILWDAGLNLVLWQDIIEIYLPVFYSDEIRKALDLNNVTGAQRIRFTFNIHKLDPKKNIQSGLF
jgi:hypothetical protein